MGACYNHAMANLQVKNVPDSLHEKLRNHARESGLTISAVVLAAVERELAERDFKMRLAEHPATYLVTPAADVLHEERSIRDAELE